jgi:hypothetical protein
MILCEKTLAVLLVIGGMEKNPGHGVQAEKVAQVLCGVWIEISNRELNVTRVDAGSLRAVVMLKLKWRIAGNGFVVSVDRKDSGC